MTEHAALAPVARRESSPEAASAAFSGKLRRVDAADHDVSLTIPAKPGYLVLARLALSAVCRLTTLEDGEVADLKLAVTEAANDYVEEDSGDRGTLDVAFRLKPDRLELELSGPPATPSEEEHALRRAIIEATVDSSDFAPGHTVLVKQL